MKKWKRFLSVLLAGTMVASLAGCGNSSSSESGSQDTPLVIASDDFSEKFSEFFAASVPDLNVADLTAAYLLINDRAGEMVLNGKDGETREYNGTSYDYSSLANCTVTENEDGTVTYDFDLREDVTFSDGEALTADDLIFTFYVLADPAYDGSATFYATPIVGMDAYRSGMEQRSSLILNAGDAGYSATDAYTEDEYTTYWTAFKTAGSAFAQEIVDFCIANGYNAEGDSVAACAANWGYELAEDATTEDFFQAMVDNYGYDLSDSGINAETAGSSISDLINAELGDNADYYSASIETGESADYIEGIEKTGDYSVRVTTSSYDATSIYNFAVAVCPLHYYGSDDAYDYDAHQFGFTKGDLSTVKSKTTTPLGAGPYKFVKYENKICYFEANESYYKGAPVTKNIQLKTTSESDKLNALIQGTVDIAEPSISKEAVAQIQGENSNGELSGDVLTTQLNDYRGYGYIGMDSENVKVGSDHASEQSIALRKAIATVLCVYRDVVIDSYYGDAASVIDYPISNTSWAAPKKSDADYSVAFSKDVDGNDIYTDSMTEDEKYAAALDAAVGYLKAAGFEFGSDGKISSVPDGAKDTYEIMIGASGSGDHPSFGILTAASEALASIGFTLNITDLTDTSQLWDAIDAGQAELWCAAWQATLDPDMYQIYHSNGATNYYHINSDELDQLVEEGRTTADQSVRKAIYKEALDYVVDFAVEIPVYQRQESVIYSSERVDVDNLPSDLTTNYGYISEIEKVATK